MKGLVSKGTVLVVAPVTGSENKKRRFGLIN